MADSEQPNALESYYLQIKKNRWHWIFSIFCRVTLAYAFIAAGVVKIVGERFANGLSPLHPMGAYLEALHHTGYYYTFVGYAQVLAAILLLIPRTVTLGALLYLPIITNIWILSYAVRFEGSIVTSPLMVLANLYILAWNYDQVRYILPFTRYSKEASLKKPEKYSTRFPVPFFSGVAAMVVMVLWVANSGFQTLPRNSLKDCQSQYANTEREAAGFAFCECIHRDGNPLDPCMEALENMKK
jgi:uncharacterized membrane protein YphA (DoxX/SURF4 family)